MRRTITYSDERPDLNLRDLAQVRFAEPVDIALALLRAGWVQAPHEVVWRRTLINDILEGLDVASRRELGRRLAESFQALETAGLVCEDVEQSQDGFYFATGLGQFVLQSSASRDELITRLPSR